MPNQNATPQPPLLQVPTHGAPKEPQNSPNSTPKSPQKMAYQLRLEEITENILLVRIPASFHQPVIVGVTFEEKLEEWVTCFIRFGVHPERLHECYEGACDARTRAGYGAFMPGCHDIAQYWARHLDSSEIERTAKRMEAEQREREESRRREVMPGSATEKFAQRFGQVAA